jgi:hypothetical protein
MITEYVTDSPESLAAIADMSQPKNVMINGSVTQVMTGSDYVAPIKIGIGVSAWQLRKALNQLGLRAAVEAAVTASTNQDLKDGWAYAGTFNSDDPLVVTMGTALGQTPAQMYALFELASTL